MAMTAIPTGWRCPSCGRINAPWVATCPCYEEAIGVNLVPTWPDYTWTPIAPWVPNEMVTPNWRWIDSDQTSGNSVSATEIHCTATLLTDGSIEVREDGTMFLT